MPLPSPRCIVAALLAVLSLTAGPRSSLAEGLGGRTVNVRDFGAKADCRRVTDGWMNKGSTTFTSGAAHFTPKDVGQPIYVLQAGAQKFPELGEVPGAPLSSRIVAVLDASTVTLADAATQDALRTHACWGTDDTAAIQRAIDSLSGTGGTVYFPPGEYRLTYQGGPGLKVAASHIRLQGSGKASALFNSTVLFKAKVKDGRTITQQVGVPVLYVGSPAAPMRTWRSITSGSATMARTTTSATGVRTASACSAAPARSTASPSTTSPSRPATCVGSTRIR